jgi:hypothetical protein
LKDETLSQANTSKWLYPQVLAAEVTGGLPGHFAPDFAKQTKALG